MKLTGFADEVSQDLTMQLTLFNKLNIHYMDIRSIRGMKLSQFTESEVDELGKLIEKAGIIVSCVATDIGTIDISADFEPHFEEFKKYIERAHKLKSKNLLIYSFDTSDKEKPEEFKGKIFDQLGRLSDYAKANKIILLHENEKGMYGCMADQCLEIMKNFHGSNLSMAFDFANFIQCRQDTKEAYEMLAPYIGVVHIKDALWEDGSVVPAGFGDGHIADIIYRMKDDKYQGFLSLEPQLTDFAGFTKSKQNDRNSRDQKEGLFTMALSALAAIVNK